MRKRTQSRNECRKPIHPSGQRGNTGEYDRFHISFGCIDVNRPNHLYVLR